MLYALHEAAYNSAIPLRLAADSARDFWGSPLNPASQSDAGRRLFASADMLANLTRRYGKPDWRIDEIEIGNRTIPVEMDTVWRSPWCKLQRFRRDPAAADRPPAPKVLIVAPLSGHHATLLRGTVRGFLQDHEVYVTDWLNARDVPIYEGRFGFHDFVDHIRAMLTEIGPGRRCWPPPR